MRGQLFLVLAFFFVAIVVSAVIFLCKTFTLLSGIGIILVSFIAGVVAFILYAVVVTKTGN